MTKPMTAPFRKIAESLQDVLPVDMAEEVKSNIRSLEEASLQKMNLVTREELIVQEKVLARTREKLEELEARIAALETRQNSDPG